MTDCQKVLFQLVRLGIGNGFDTDLMLPSPDTQWYDIYDLVSRQGMQGVAYDGLQVLYDSCLFNESEELSLDQPKYDDIRYQWFGQAISMEKAYDRYESAISHLASFYNSHGIDMMILKGYGLSKYYPVPNHRPCGDVDIWLFGKQCEADRIMELEKGIKSIKSSHHTIFYFEGQEIENHISFFEEDIGFGRKDNKIVDSLSSSKNSEIYIRGEKAYYPNANLNAFFLLRHSSSHFSTENITIRHLLDWAFFIEKNYEHIDWDLLYKNAVKRNMHLFLDCQNAICVEYLGFSSAHFPVRANINKYKERVINEIIDPAFVEIAPTISDSFIKYCYVKARRNFSNKWKYSITQKESFLLIFWRFAKNRILHPYSFSEMMQR